MATKSDFAQKLLHDLRVRKKRMAAAAQNPSRQSTQTSRVAHGNAGQTSRSSRQINALESANSRAGNTSGRSNRSSRSLNINESSNQIVLYGNGQSSRQQVRDLSMAIAFAFENNGNLSNIGASTANPVVNFFNRFGRKTRDSQKMDTTSLSTGQFPTVSNIHITEVSKGVQKLNQILRACSNGFSFESSSSFEVGKELLKGAVDLEESLRMLVNLQEASQYANNTQKKGRLKLLGEEDEDEQDDNAKIAEPWKLDRPKFSFDKPSRNSHVVQNATRQEDLSLSTQVVSHKRSTSYVQDSIVVQNNNNSISSAQSMQEKRRISNVVTKLMGLEEIPQNEDFILKKNDSNGKQGKVLKQNTKLCEPLIRESNNQQKSHTIAANQVSRHQIFDDSKWKQNPTGDKQSKTIESERKTHKAEDKTNNRIGYKSGANSIETRKTDKRVLLQEQVLKRGEPSEDKRHKDQNSRQVESIIPSKPKKSTATKKKKSPGNGKSTTPTEKIPMKDPPNRIHPYDAPMIDISHQTAPDKEKIKKEDQIQDSCTREPQLDVEKPNEASVKQKAAIPRKVQRSAIPRKIDVLMSRKNANANHLTRSIKQTSNMLKDLKQQMHNKNHIRKRMEEQSDSMVKNEYQIQSIQNTRTLNDDSDTVALNSGKVSDDLQTMEQPYAFKDEQELKKCDQRIGNHEEESTELCNLSQHENKQVPASEKHKQLTEPEKELKEMVIKSQMFLSTSEALFRLNIPVSFLHAAEQDYEVADNKLVLNCAYEVMRRKARRHEKAYNNPYTKTTISGTKIRSIDDLIKQLSKDLESLKFYGGNVSDERDVAARLHKMLDKDIYNKDADVNSMWDIEWSNIMSLIPEKEDIVRDVERYMLNGLLDEITNDLLLLTVSV